MKWNSPRYFQFHCNDLKVFRGRFITFNFTKKWGMMFLSHNFEAPGTGKEEEEQNQLQSNLVVDLLYLRFVVLMKILSQQNKITKNSSISNKLILHEIRL